MPHSKWLLFMLSSYHKKRVLQSSLFERWRMMINNEIIKRRIREVGLYQYQIAKEIGISEPQFIRWLRYELTDEKKQIIYEAIDKLVTERR